ncbi:MAG: hypothetical protein HC878_00010 [Leptolyngbyaceae cyanobacterium SL_5_14]|nr:hypothetical protein [Leptolyngbyaceae cyanobacterium SL_5_14]
MINTDVLNNLPNASKQLGIHAYLIDLDNSYRWDFLYNPEKINFNIDAKYQEIPTFLTSLPDQQYLYTSGETHEFSNLLLQSYAEEKSLETHLEKLKSVLYADVPNNKYEPSLLYFIWGNYRFGTCRLLKVSGERSLVLSGEAAQVILSISLVRVPQPETPAGTTVDPRSQAIPEGSRSASETPPPGVISRDDPMSEGLTLVAANTNATALIIPETVKSKTIEDFVRNIKGQTQKTVNPLRFRQIRYSYSKSLKRVEMYDSLDRLVGIATNLKDIKYADLTNISAFAERYAIKNS